MCSRARGLIWCTVTLDALSSRARPMGDMAYCSFLKNGDKIKVVIRMRGREMARQGAGKEVMLNFYKMVEELANIDKQPEAEGRNIIMMLSAKKK